MKQRCKVYLIDQQGDKFFGRGPAELLEKVGELGSLHRAAKEMYLSYSKAVKLIHTAEQGFGFPLLITETGGKGGGGSMLTEDARWIIAQFRAYEADVQAAAAQRFPQYFPTAVQRGD